VVFNDFFADGQAKAGAMRLTVRGERLKKFVGNFRRDAGAGVLNLNDDFASASFEPQKNLAAVVENILGVIDEIVKDAIQSASVERENFCGRLVFQHDADGFGGRVGFQFGCKFDNKIAKIIRLQVGLTAAFSEGEDVGDEIVDAVHLPLDAGLNQVACFRSKIGIGKIFGREADDAQRIFLIVNDAARKITDDREAFGCDHFAEVKLVEFAEATAD